MEIGVPATSDAVPQRLKGAAGTGRFDGIRAKCRGDSILQLLQGASEDLASLRAQGPLPLRLEFGPEPKKAKAVVARNVESGGELLEQDVQLPPRIARKAAEPGIESPRRAVIHGRTTLTRGRLSRRVVNVRYARRAGSRAGPLRNP